MTCEGYEMTPGVGMEYYVWAAQVLGAGSGHVQQVFEVYENPKELYEQREEAVALLGFSSQEAARIRSYPLNEARAICDQCSQMGFRIVHFQQEDYPKRLRAIYDFPVVLYLKGVLKNMDDQLPIAVVGTRTPSGYGTRAAAMVCRDLALAGASIVSGLAVGIDGIAHAECIRAGGYTIGVAGCGLDIDYPRDNAPLRKAIEERGLVISEYPPGTRPEGWRFPIRNRLISALGEGVFVVEGGIHSGVMHTANHALEQGRDVFALPGDIFSAKAEGPFVLLRNGAIPVMSALDILGEYAMTYDGKLHLERVRPNFYQASQKQVQERKVSNSLKNNSKNNGTMNKETVPDRSGLPKKEAEAAYNSLSQGARDVYSYIGEGHVHADEIKEGTSLDFQQVLSALTELELEGLIQSHPGSNYSKVMVV